MVRDKKVLDGRLRLVLVQEIGRAQVSDQFSVDHLKQLLIRSCHSG